MDQNRNKNRPYGFEFRKYSPSSAQSPVEIKEEKLQPNPTRPNHLGPSFIPQTEFLSVNVGDRSSSPGQQSSYTTPSTSSPVGISDKSKNPNNVCNQCDKLFSSSSALVKHKLTHSDERKFVCHICGRGFKRQDHLNGHMITHRDKKPHECHYAECGKSYCDMRSLRRHLENHHHSPPGGTTPGYLPRLMLYPGVSEEEINKQREHTVGSSLTVPEEIPRPSSAPLVPPEPRRITRTRRSSSGEETHIQLDRGMLHEIEQRRLALPFVRRQREASDEYIKPREDKYPLGASSHPSSIAPPEHLLKTVSSIPSRFGGLEKHKHELERFAEYENHYAASREQKHPSGSETSKEYDRLYSAYPQGGPPRINTWSQHQNVPTRPSPAQGSMPYLLNIRNPFTVSPHGPYSGQHTEDPSNLSKSEHDARNQAVNTYLQMWASGQHSNLTPEQLFMYQRHRSNHPSTPTDPMAIAVAAAKEPATERHPYSTIRETMYGIQPTTAKWQSVMQDDSVTMEKEKKSSSYYHPTTITSIHDGYPKPPNLSQERNIIDEPFKPSESNHKFPKNNNNNNNNINRFYDRTSTHLDSLKQTRDFHPYDPKRLDHSQHSLDAVRHFPRDQSPHRYQDPHYQAREVMGKFIEPPRLRVEASEGMSSAAALSPNRKRPRPGPIIIPPAVNNRNIPTTISPSRHFGGFKGIYTPPAMLSPRSIFFNPPGFPSRMGGGVTPQTPGRMTLVKRRSSNLELPKDQTPQQAHTQQTQVTPVASVPEESATISATVDTTEPKINIGSEFQAVLPHVLNRSEAQKDIHRASLMWSPLKEDDQKHKEVEAYLDMACSLVLYGGSNNKEYALHILQRTRGNVKEAVRLLLSRRHILRADDPNADYHYSGSVRWTAKERLAFRQSYRSKGKVFMEIQKEVGTKSVQQCVEFYYLWKAMHPESFRARTRMVEVESEQDDEEVPPTPTAAVAPLSTLREPVFECDYPQCRARFVSRQALNGHIRVHGGSFTKPVDTRKPKVKADPNHSSTHLDGLPSPPKKKKTTQPDPSIIITNTSEGPQQQFQCKVCGRVFNKVKSRSAHMKTHVKRDENNKPIKNPKNVSKKQQQQQQQQMSRPPQPQPSAMNPMTVYAHA